VGISCPGTCSEHFDEGATIRLIASADPKSTFAGWSGAGCEGADSTVCVVQISQAQSVIASFTKELAGAVSPDAVASRRSGISVRLLSAGGSGASLAVAVPSAGSVSALGRDLAATGVKAEGAGIVPLRLRLAKAGRRALARHGEVRTRVGIVFVPLEGGARARTTRAIAFRRSVRH
jgi:hypothetical protein